MVHVDYTLCSNDAKSLGQKLSLLILSRGWCSCSHLPWVVVRRSLLPSPFTSIHISTPNMKRHNILRDHQYLLEEIVSVHYTIFPLAFGKLLPLCLPEQILLPFGSILRGVWLYKKNYLWISDNSQPVLKINEPRLVSWEPPIFLQPQSWKGQHEYLCCLPRTR